MTDWSDPDWDAKTKHTFSALKSFEFWGRTIGRIGGDMKEKWGSPRWSARIGSITSLYDVVKPGWVYYQWSPEGSKTHFVLDVLNNWSIIILQLSMFRYLTWWWKIVFYNIAHIIPMIKHYKQAYSIYIEADWQEYLWCKRYAERMGKRYEKQGFNNGEC